MIEVIVSADAALRQKKKTELMKKYPDATIADDTAISAETLRACAYSSLFDADASVIIVSYPGDAIAFDAPLVKELAASPSQFFFFERSLSADAKKLFAKYGSVTALDAKSGKPAQQSLFYEASALVTEQNRLKRWQQLQQLLHTDAPEAFIGIMYWKLRDLAIKGNAHAKEMYDALITAHAQAWISGTPLAGAVEKVLLMIE